MAFLNISVKNKNGVLKQIDEQNYLGLSNCTRLELYSFMLALGYNAGYQSDFEGSKDSLVREEYVKDSNIKHAFAAVYFGEHPDKVEDVADTDKVYAITDKYVNTGFSVITQHLKDYSEHALAMKLLNEMDGIYEEIKDSL